MDEGVSHCDTDVNMLRPYQTQSIAEIRAHFAAGNKRVLCHLPTGAGKTIILAEILYGAFKKGKRALFVVRGRELVKQGSRRLVNIDGEPIPHGVIMAGHPRTDDPIQVCSISTLHARKLRPKADFIVIDEVHQAGGDSYKAFCEEYPDAFFLGVTATPYQQLSIEHCCTSVVAPLTYKDLVALGFLVRPRVFAPPNKTVDVSSLKMTGDDFNQKQAFDLMGKTKICQDVVSAYQEFGRDKPCICYAVNIAHANMLAQQFRASGITAACIDQTTPDELRQLYVKESKEGQIRVLVNCMVLTTGVDLPWIETISIARPTASLCLHIQMNGRGSRPFPGKEYFTIIDHVGNTKRLGFIDEYHAADLKGHNRVATEQQPKLCAECGAYYEPILPKCPYCGHEPAKKERRAIEVEDSHLEELTSIDRKASDVREFVNKHVAIAIKAGLKRGWVFHKIRDKYDEATAKRVWKFKRTSGVDSSDFIRG